MEIKIADKCYVTDAENNTYIDTTMGSGAQIIGHNNPLIQEIGEQIKKGTIYTIPNCHTKVVNYYLKKFINPDFSEQYIYCNSGTEANMRAIRLARAYTGKTLIGRFHGGWHGGLDGFLEEHPSNRGVPSETNRLFRVLPYNEDSCFEKITPDMAAVIIEPVQGSNPRSDIKQFLQRLREHCTKTGVLLIFDEVMTGFRLSARGGSGVFDISPDLVTYGKVLGGGFPIGAVGGKDKIMRTKDVFYGGTFSANPLSMYAASLILKSIVEETHIQYDKLNHAGKLFRDGLNEFFIAEDKKMRVIGCGPINRIIFTDKFIRNRKDRDSFESENAQEEFSNKLKEFGVFVNGNGLYHLSMSHTPQVIEQLSNSIKETVHRQERSRPHQMAKITKTNIGIENVIKKLNIEEDDAILYLGGRVDDDNLYPDSYVKYLNHKIKELNPKKILCHSHWYAWKYYQKGILDESTDIDMIFCYLSYLQRENFQPIDVEYYGGSHIQYIKYMIEKNPDVIFAAYNTLNSDHTPLAKVSHTAQFTKSWFTPVTYYSESRTCRHRHFHDYNLDNLTYFGLHRGYRPLDLVEADLGHGNHGRNGTDGFSILNSLLRLGFKNVNILGFTAFGSDEDDTKFSKYKSDKWGDYYDGSYSPQEAMKMKASMNTTYFDLPTSEDQRAEADILKYYVDQKKINNLEDYGELVRYLNGE